MRWWGWIGVLIFLGLGFLVFLIVADSFRIVGKYGDNAPFIDKAMVGLTCFLILIGLLSGAGLLWWSAWLR